MKKDNSEYKRLVRFIIALAVILASILAACIFFVSIELTNIKRSINTKDQSVSAQLDRLDPKALSREIVSLIEMPVAPTPQNGKDGNDGRDGKDSVSTHTIVEKQMTIKEQVPIKGEDGKDGKDAREINLGITPGGKHIWKWSNDREWQEFEIVEIDL